MSPEQCRGAEGDERSDIYSLAVVLYEMLNGAPPFTGSTEYEVIHAQISASPAPLVPKAAGVTPALEAAIMIALSKKPEQRFPTMRAFSDALGATALRPDATGVIRNATHLVEAPQFDPPDAAGRSRALDVARSRTTSIFRSLRSRGLFVTGALALALVAIGGGLFFWLGPAPSVDQTVTSPPSEVSRSFAPPPSPSPTTPAPSGREPAPPPAPEPASQPAEAECGPAGDVALREGSDVSSLPGLEKLEGEYSVVTVNTLRVKNQIVKLDGVGAGGAEAAKRLSAWMRANGDTVHCIPVNSSTCKYACDIGPQHIPIATQILDFGWARPAAP